MSRSTSSLTGIAQRPTLSIGKAKCAILESQGGLIIDFTNFIIKSPSNYCCCHDPSLEDKLKYLNGRGLEKFSISCPVLDALFHLIESLPHQLLADEEKNSL